MFDLRTRFEALQKRFGTAGMAVAVIALVAALGGTALAAGAFTAKQKKEIEKIAKKFAGQPGAQGPQGPAGPAGPSGTNGTNGATGATGPAGATGATGAKGATGATGTAGASVTAEPASVGECPTGGSRFSVGNTEEHVCNGAKGATGPAGPVVAGNPLPVGQTLTGMLNLEKPLGASQARGVMDFAPFTLRNVEDFFEVLVEERLIYVPVSESSTPGAKEGCPGTYQEPAADQGYACFYFFQVENLHQEISPESLFSWTKYGVPVFAGANQTQAEHEGYAVLTWAYQE